jgi:hypothetical protein
MNEGPVLGGLVASVPRWLLPIAKDKGSLSDNKLISSFSLDSIPHLFIILILSLILCIYSSLLLN